MPREDDCGAGRWPAVHTPSELPTNHAFNTIPYRGLWGSVSRALARLLPLGRYVRMAWSKATFLLAGRPAEGKDRDAAERMENESKLDGLDAGSLQCILGFLLFHDPILLPYHPSMHVGHRDLVFWYDGSRYMATTWRPRTHFGRCRDHRCGCCRVRYAGDALRGCQECYTGWTLSTVSTGFRGATKLNAQQTSSCECGGCASSWIAAGWDCRKRCESEFWG